MDFRIALSPLAAGANKDIDNSSVNSGFGRRMKEDPMMTVTAELVSRSKNGKRAMTVVRGDAGTTQNPQPFAATRHVERQGNVWVGNNPDPRTPIERIRAIKRVEFAKASLFAVEADLQRAQAGEGDKDKAQKAELNVNRAKVVLKVAEENLEQTLANFPLQVQFDILA